MIVEYVCICHLWPIKISGAPASESSMHFIHVEPSSIGTLRSEFYPIKIKLLVEGLECQMGNKGANRLLYKDESLRLLSSFCSSHLVNLPKLRAFSMFLEGLPIEGPDLEAGQL